MKWFPVFIVYLDRDVEGKSVTASCADCRIEEALDRVLAGTSLSWSRQGNQVVLRGREARASRPLSALSGIVTDSLTGESVPGAVIILRDSALREPGAAGRWCPANEYGFYALPRLSPGTYMLTVRAIGYENASLPLVVSADRAIRFDVVLRPRDITLEEITVEGERTVIASSGGIARGVYIRSTPSDRNNYLLDGARIYNPSHFGGVLSTFSGETLDDVQVVVGELSPWYGGDVGGILDLSVRQGNLERLAGSAGTGTMGSHVSLEGPLPGGTTFLASFRRSYPDAAIPFLKNGGTPGRLGSYEAIAKLTRRISSGSSVSLCGYAGGDSYTNSVEGAGEELSNDFAWGNRMINLRWLDIASPSTFLYASADYTRYDLRLGQTLAGDPQYRGGISLPSWFTIEDIGVRAGAEHYYDEEHTLRAGVGLTRHRLAGSLSAFATQVAPLEMRSASAWESSVYLQDQWLILPQVTARLGARATSFAGDGGTYSAVDPRFSLLVEAGEQTSLYTSLTAINEFMHPYRNSGLFIYYPGIFWYPPTDQARPSTSLQATLGLEERFGRDDVVGSAEVFYRSMHNLHEFVIDSAAAPRTDLNGAVILGTGTAYGAELSVRKRSGNLAGSLTYSLTWGSQRFAELNAGEPFVPRFDRRHELQIEISWAPDEHLTLGALCVLASHLPQSNPEKITGLRSTGPLSTPDTGYATSSSGRGLEIIDVNGNRIPGFQRLELSVARSLSLWGLPCRVSLRMLNGYGLLDPFVWTLRGSRDIRSKWDIMLEEPALFPLYPLIGLTVRF